MVKLQAGVEILITIVRVYIAFSTFYRRITTRVLQSQDIQGGKGLAVFSSSAYRKYEIGLIVVLDLYIRLLQHLKELLVHRTHSEWSQVCSSGLVPFSKKSIMFWYSPQKKKLLVTSTKCSRLTLLGNYFILTNKSWRQTHSIICQNPFSHLLAA